MLLGSNALSAHSQVQLCWVVGKFDDTVYYGEAEGREDRSESFAELLYISGIEHAGVRCARHESAAHVEFKTRLLRDWQDLEFEIVNTSYMSDLDY
jgi:hypothetical protein